MIDTQNTASYTDFESMSALRRRASDDPQKTLKEVARHFESLYLNMMLKSMRQASMGDPLFDSNNSELYRNMYDQQIALQLSQHQGIGLADVLVKQLQGSIASPAKTAAKTGSAEQGSALNRTHQAGVADIRSQFAGRIINTSVPVATQAVGDEPTRFESRHQFVETLLPHAQQAADELGVAPQVLIAQAALETGWGQQVTRLPDNRSSYNLFNIKADSSWNGHHVSKQTVEFRDGLPQTEPATFRVYSSYAESFADYVKFIKNNPRYSTALDNVVQPERYVSELQKAGYATDPNYAAKISDIYQREIVGAPYSELLMDV